MYGTVKTVVGETVFSSSAAAIVITLPVEPGSYTSCTDGFLISESSTFLVLFGLKVGAVACATISPVFGSITMTVPLDAAESFTAVAIASAATH